MQKPEQVKVAVTLNDGSLAVMSYVTVGYERDGITVQFSREASIENIERELARRNWADCAWRFIADADLPSRDYRDAWKDDGKVIVHDMPKAREIHRQRIRERRAKLFEQLDNERRDAEDSGNEQALRRARQKRQRLKDAPADPRIEAAQTVEELGAIDPIGDELRATLREAL